MMKYPARKLSYSTHQNTIRGRIRVINKIADPNIQKEMLGELLFDVFITGKPKHQQEELRTYRESLAQFFSPINPGGK